MESAAQWLAGYDERLTRAAADAKAVSRSLSQVRGSATSPRGEVAVQVGPGGALEDIRLTPAARALEAEQLAKLILATAQQAQRTVGAQVVEIMAGYVGEGPSLDFVKEHLPPAAVREAEERRGPVDDDEYFANPEVIVR
ncbi:YbaB/EbfC family nucleoid-associated protein [Saccharopolyspora thermophila]|uniref:YbaB/EbfC family nucleoid-associated protein n=1 Tax=Saccharopolyspora thermophila TaxID=89367 RepID=UPI00166C34D1|nr:YbaB/EbfC family nucleoid-associated protein [Saccharopolyspora subtropica]